MIWLEFNEIIEEITNDWLIGCYSKLIERLVTKFKGQFCAQLKAKMIELQLSSYL